MLSVRQIFESLEGELFPKIYTNCKRLGVRIPASYFSTLFLHQLPYEAATRAWDLVRQRSHRIMLLYAKTV